MPATLKSYVLTDRYICCRPRSAPQRRSSTKLAAQRTASSRQAHGALRTSVRAPEAAGKNSPAATEWGQRSRRGITGACGVGGGTGQYSELYTICMRTQVLMLRCLASGGCTRGQHQRFAGVLLRWPRSRQRCVRPGLGSRTHHAAPIPAEGNRTGIAARKGTFATSVRSNRRMRHRETGAAY